MSIHLSFLHFSCLPPPTYVRERHAERQERQFGAHVYVLTPHFEIRPTPTPTHLSGCRRQLPPADAQSCRERRGAHNAREVVLFYRHDRFGTDVVDAPVHNRGARAADGRDTNGNPFASLVGIVVVHDGEGDRALGLPVIENYLLFPSVLAQLVDWENTIPRGHRQNDLGPALVLKNDWKIVVPRSCRVVAR